MTHAELLKATAALAERFGRAPKDAVVSIMACGWPVRWINFSITIDDDCAICASAEDALNAMATKLAGMVPTTSDDAARRLELAGDVAKEAA